MNRKTTTLLVWVALLAIVLLALVNRDSGDSSPSFISAEQAQKLIDREQVRSYRSDQRGIVLRGKNGAYWAVRPTPAAFYEQLASEGIPYEAESESSDFSKYLPLLIVSAILVFAFIYFMRKMRGTSMNTIFELRKTKARKVESTDAAKFADIGGNRQSVELMADIVDFLREPERWTKAGLRIPRGILVVGPPGTGKTLLARAVAGETKSAFFYTSATEFVEMFVGIGAARVRDTFEKALAQQPAVIFIDELDAIGRRRGSGMGTIHEEREQTLNQLLVLLDGLEQHKRLVIIAATNRPDVLDAALLRPGRFDRMLRLSLPELNERVEILKIHTRNKPLDAGMSLERIAEQTDGFSGADLESLTNAAGLLAVRRTRVGANGSPAPVSITNADFDQAREEMTKANRQFDRLDSVLVESVSQFAEPVGRALARVTLAGGTVVEGEVQWMNSTHIKLRLNDGAEVIVVKENASQIQALDGTDKVSQGDFRPDRWAGRTIDAG